MLSTSLWSSSPTLSCRPIYATIASIARQSASVRRKPVLIARPSSTPFSGSPLATIALPLRSLHSSTSSRSEDLYDFEKKPKAAPKRRISSSHSKSSSAASRSSPSRSSRPEEPHTSNVKPKTSSIRYKDELMELENSKTKKFSGKPRVTFSAMRRIQSDKIKEIRREQNSSPLGTPQARTAAKQKIMPTVIIEGINPKYDMSTLAVKAAVRPGNATDPEHVNRAKAIAQQLQLPYLPTATQLKQEGIYDFAVVVGAHHISLMNLEDPLSPLVFSDFITGPTAHRKTTGGSDPKSPIMRAVTIHGKSIGETHLLDATGGLGVDAFMFASAGFKVTVLEKNVLVYTLLQDAVQRAKQVPQLKSIMKRISLHHCDALEWFEAHSNAEDAPDVIYLDPMYPIESKMKSAPKKGMAIARALIGKVDRADDLVRSAITCAKEKVVLKRPYYALESIGTLNSFKSRSLRFEVFNRDSWSKVGEAKVPRVFSPSMRTSDL